MRRWRTTLLAAALLAPGAWAQTAASEAERLVFLQDHLAGSRHAQSLRYRYEEEAEGQSRLVDQATVTLSDGADQRCCDVHGEYLSGPLRVQLPDIADAHGNPVILYFLEGEVRRLQRTTGGQAAHFRRRIRQALADAATVSEESVRWAGASVPARVVRIAPFRDDPYSDRFREQAGTQYLFVLSDGVPGGVYQVSATVPASGADAPVARRSLTLQETKP